MTTFTKKISQLPLETVTAGLLAVVISFFSSATIVYSAAIACGANVEQIGSWFMVLCLGCAVISIGFSWYYKAPVLAAWSTPGAALLATSAHAQTLGQLTGAFLFASVLTLLLGISGVLERILRRIPVPVASALLAGILLDFCVKAFGTLEVSPWLAGSMFVCYLIARYLIPRYAVILVLVVGLIVAALQHQLNFSGFRLQLTQPQWVTPEFDLSTMISVGIPLFVVTLASQHLPGLALLKANEYKTSSSWLVGGSGLVSAVLAPFGGFAVNLAAITAAICAGPEAHADPARRYWAAIWAGIFYLLCAVFAVSIVGALNALPSALVVALSGIALLATLAGSLRAAMAENGSREAALVTFLVTVSNISFLGIGAPFWALVAGTLVLLLTRR